MSLKYTQGGKDYKKLRKNWDKAYGVNRKKKDREIQNNYDYDYNENPRKSKGTGCIITLLIAILLLLAIPYLMTACGLLAISQIK